MEYPSSLLLDSFQFFFAIFDVLATLKEFMVICLSSRNVLLDKGIASLASGFVYV